MLKDAPARDRYERSMGLRKSGTPRVSAAAREAAAFVSSPASRADEPIEARLIRAEEALDAQQPWEAIRLLEEAVAAAGGALKRQAQVLLGRAYADRERPREAEKVLLEVLQADPLSVPACLLLGRIYRERGMGKRARGMFEKALEIDPAQEEALRELAALAAEPAPPPPADRSSRASATPSDRPAASAARDRSKLLKDGEMRPPPARAPGISSLLPARRPDILTVPARGGAPEWARPHSFLLEREGLKEQGAKDIVHSVAERVTSGRGFELVDVEVKRERGGHFVRLYVDKEGGIGLDELQSVSEEVSAILDAEDPIDSTYTLEVSSPGLDRPLKGEADYRRFVGRLVKLSSYEPWEGRRHWTGRLQSVEGGQVTVTLEKEKGTTARIPLEKIAHGRLEVEFK